MVPTGGRCGSISRLKDQTRRLFVFFSGFGHLRRRPEKRLPEPVRYLSNLIKKGTLRQVATATVATDGSSNPLTVASVATGVIGWGLSQLPKPSMTHIGKEGGA